MDKNQEAFEALLLRLEPDQPDTQKRYKQLRLKMVKFFVWRRCEDPESLADETISRVIKNVGVGEEVYADKPYSYVYGVAKYVFMEFLRDKKKRGDLVNNLVEHSQIASGNQEDCRKECLQKLPLNRLKLLKAYYLAAENREELAQTLNISLNALRLQVHRIKQELRACYEDCLK